MANPQESDLRVERPWGTFFYNSFLLWPDFFLHTVQMCGFDTSWHASQSCSGDSGGPLTIDHAHTQYLVGVTSYGDPDCGSEE